MTILKQSYEIMNRSEGTRTQFIEKVARVCYKSEGKIEIGSDLALIGKLIEREHEAMLEHDYVCIELGHELYSVLHNYTDNSSSDIMKYFVFTDDSRYLVSANVRAWRDFFKRTLHKPLIQSIARSISMFTPALTFLFSDLSPWDTKHLKSVTLVKEASLSCFEAFAHKRETVRFITDRGVSHELVRHRVASFAQESTRYVKYNNIEVIEPAFDWGHPDEDSDVSRPLFSTYYKKWLVWKHAMGNSEVEYQALIDLGAAPQEARSVLPNSLKTEIVVTATLSQWKAIFKLRVAASAHPQIRELMRPLQEEWKQTYSPLFT